MTSVGIDYLLAKGALSLPELAVAEEEENV